MSEAVVSEAAEEEKPGEEVKASSGLQNDRQLLTFPLQFDLVPSFELMSMRGTAQERGLCETCAKYDWESHLGRYLRGSIARPAFCCEAYGNGQSVVRRPATEISHTLLKRGMASFNLSPLATMSESQEHCSLCRLVVDAVNASVAPKTSNDSDVSEEPVQVLAVDATATRHLDTALYIHIPVHYEDDREFIGFHFTLERSSSSNPFARQVSSSRQVGLDMIKTWWKTCNQDHTTCMNEASTKNDYDEFMMRVIDVTRDRVISLPPGSKYVALSYVWGSTNWYLASWADFIDPTLTPQVDKRVSRHAYLPLQRDNLPQTIRDAMIIVGAIGERYLWVDALCIVQDCDKEKLTTIAVMDEIYKSASLTILAAGGDGANSGLGGGVQPVSSGIKNVTGVLEGLPMIKIESPFQLEDTVWSSRGWTFQEDIFSKRRVVFVNNRVYYECLNGCWGGRQPTEKRKWLTEDISGLGGNHFSTYGIRVFQYTRRKLTHESDILYAFAGIMRDYETKNPTTHLWGLPLDAFNRALLWRSSSTVDKPPYPTPDLSRRTARQRPDAPLFPSWSWAGWVGPVMYYRSTMTDGVKFEPQVAWPWDQSFESPFSKKAFADGILEFSAESAVLDYAVLEQDKAYRNTYEFGRFNETWPERHRKRCYFKFDDGTYWTRGSRECILLSRREGTDCVFVPNVDSVELLIVSRDGDGLYSREGLITVTEEVWEAAKPTRKQIRLG